MPFSRWVCNDNSNNMVLRIVHPGGHVELHDRPVTAAEIMCRNPRCCVAYPYVFQQPWAVVAPETVLMLGQKFYVVPVNTIRKLQRLSPRHPSAHDTSTSSSVDENKYIQSSREEEDDGMLSICCVFRNKSTARKSKNYNQHFKDKRNRSEIRSDVRNLSPNVHDRNGDSWLANLLNGVVTKANVGDMRKETKTSSSSGHICDTNTRNSKRTQDSAGNGKRGSPKKGWSSENWQPSLQSITEE